MKFLNAKRIKAYLSRFELYRNKGELLYGAIFFLVYIALVWIFFTSVPINSSLPKTFIIQSGSSLAEISRELKDAGFIRSKTIFSSMVIMRAGETKIVSGEYLFTKPVTFFELIDRLTTGDYGIATKQIRLPEGITIKEMGELFEANFADFDKEAFYQLTEGKEGRLFPDTYFFLENVKAFEVATMLENTFAAKIKEIESAVTDERSLEDIIIMASIVEREADAESKEEVAAILWKRIELEKPLQVDAPFVYSIGKGTFDLHMDDLNDEENPYNTYEHLGLPPTPISNPGLESLKAAAFPTTTPYLYFLTGRDGNMYYAKSFEEHKRNRILYLD